MKMAIITKLDLQALHTGTRVFVKWSGGNGPWEYVLQKDRFGNPWFSTETYPTVVVGFPSEAETMEIDLKPKQVEEGR